MRQKEKQKKTKPMIFSAEIVRMWGEYTSSNIITYIALSCKSVRIIERALWETLKPYGQYITV